MEMMSLVYVSSAVLRFTDAELHEILATSRRNNANRGITGLLLYIDGNFMQAIEGPPDAVIHLHETIAADPRHRGLTTLLQEPIAQRAFPDWAMGFRNIDKVPDELADSVSTFLRDPVANIATGRTVSQVLLNSFRRNMAR